MIDGPHPPRTTFVDDPEHVGDALGLVEDAIVGVDVERADAERYFRRAALIQVGADADCVLIDGVTIDLLPDLEAFLGSDRLAVLHAVENDLEPLAAKGVVPRRLADTAVAASLLGLPTGLGQLLTEVLGIELEGDKSAFQRADWEARPLSAEMAAYAAGDVVHLPRLWSALAGRLAECGRTAWYEEELAWTVERSRQNTRHWTKVQGSARMSPEQRAVLRAVWTERERLSREHDVAPNRLLHDDVLRDIAVNPPGTEAQIVRRSRRRRSLLRRYAGDLLAAVSRGTRATPELRQGSGRHWSDTDRELYDRLRATRAQVAKDLGIDSGVLCPSRPLWAAIAGEPGDGEQLCELAELRRWQADLLAEPLWETYAACRSRETDA